MTNPVILGKPSDLSRPESEQGPGPVIEVTTQRWDMEEYRLKYYATARLVDVSGPRELMSTRCAWVVLEQVSQEELPKPTGMDAFGQYNPSLLHTVDEAIEQKLYADNGALLKQNLRKAAELCADRIAAAFRGRATARRP